MFSKLFKSRTVWIWCFSDLVNVRKADGGGGHCYLDLCRSLHMYAEVPKDELKESLRLF